MKTPDKSSAACTCGHEPEWHNHGGVGNCEHNMLCVCDGFTPRDPHVTLRDPFADDVLERLLRSNAQYQQTHGHYIVPLAERLLASRAEVERLREGLHRCRADYHAKVKALQELRSENARLKADRRALQADRMRAAKRALGEEQTT